MNRIEDTFKCYCSEYTYMSKVSLKRNHQLKNVTISLQCSNNENVSIRLSNIENISIHLCNNKHILIHLSNNENVSIFFVILKMV